MTDALVNPITTPDAYDYITLAGVQSPGLARVQAPRPYKWDKKPAKGSAGATITFQGDGLATVTIEFVLWTVGHFVEWGSFLRLLKKPADATEPVALDIEHPTLADNDISSVVVEEIGTLTHKGKQEFSVKVKFSEYRPPKPKGGTPGSSTTTANKDEGGTDPFNSPALQQAEEELNQLLEQAKQP